MPYDAFISHSSRDKSVADAACASLEQRGIRCWIAPRDVQPGEEWGKSIVEAIKDCRILVLILSSAANTSPHIIREVERAIHWGKVIVPFRVDETLPEGALEFHLSGVHWLDALTPPLERHLQRLAETLLRILGREAPRADEAVVVAPSREPPPDGGGSAPVTPEGRFALAYTLQGYDESPVHSMAFSPDGAHLATGGKGGVTLWDVASRRKLERQPGSVRAVAFSPGGKWVAYGERAGTIELWDVRGDRSVRLGRKGPLRGVLARRGPIVAFNPDGRRLAAGGDDAVVTVWDVDTARVSFRLERHRVFMGGIVNSIAYSPDGRLLASAGHGGIWLWTAREGRELRSFDDVDPMDALSLVFSPDSRLLAYLGQDGQIRILDPNGRTETRILNPDGLEAVRNPQELVDAAGGGLAFHPSGSLIASAGERAIDIRDPVTGMPVWSQPQTAMVSCVVFSPDGRTLASGGYDGKVRLWTVGEGS